MLKSCCISEQWGGQQHHRAPGASPELPTSLSVTAWKAGTANDSEGASSLTFGW